MFWYGYLHVSSLRACNLKTVCMTISTTEVYELVYPLIPFTQSKSSGCAVCAVQLWHSSRLSHTAHLLSVSRTLHAVPSHRTLPFVLLPLYMLERIVARQSCLLACIAGVLLLFCHSTNSSQMNRLACGKEGAPLTK